MKTLHLDKYESLIIDNGSQFSRKNSNMKHYCEESITGKHIWASVYHHLKDARHAEEVPQARQQHRYV